MGEPKIPFDDQTCIISDPHFFHENIGCNCNRPDGWQETSIENWNRLIQPEEVVFHVGDLALADAARLLRSTCRASDVLARFGGDEFIVLMMESREDGAQQLIDRFDEQFADFNARSRREYPLTISCGVARTSLDRPIPLEELINMADRAMYVNKRARRQAPAEI